MPARSAAIVVFSARIAIGSTNSAVSTLLCHCGQRIAQLHSSFSGDPESPKISTTFGG